MTMKEQGRSLQLKTDLWLYFGILGFRGKAMDMAQNAISHILNKLPSTCGLFPVIYESYGGCNSSGDYTTEVVFQAIA